MLYTIKRTAKNPALEPAMAQSCQVLIQKAEKALDKEIPGELEETHDHLAAMNIQLSRLLIGTPEPVAPQFSTPSQFTITTHAPPTQTPVEKKTIIPPSSGVKPPTHTPEVKNKESIKIKQDILHLVYTIEQYMANVSLDSMAVSECKFMIARAHKELDKDNQDDLLKIHRELKELTKKVERIIPPVAGFESHRYSDEKKDPHFKRDDTKPFKIFQG